MILRKKKSTTPVPVPSKQFYALPFLPDPAENTGY